MSSIIPITTHPSQRVVTRARLIISGGGVAIERRCEQGVRAKVRGEAEPIYTVTIGPAGATCTCAALRMCAHIGAAGWVAPDVAKSPCEQGADGCCVVCARLL